MRRLLTSIDEIRADEPGFVSLLKEFAQPVSLCSYLGELRADGARLAEVAARSFPHPLGFDKIVLETHETGVKLRLHVWTNTPSVNIPPDIHDHFWNYTSVVIAGALATTEYEIGPRQAEGASYFHYRIHPLPDGGHRQEYVGTQFLRALSHGVLRVRSVSSQQSTTIHYVRPAIEGLCATVVLQGAPNRLVNNVYSESPPNVASKVVAESPFAPETLSALLQATIAGVRSSAA